MFNIGDQLYRNHSSFIKDLAPEIGRGVRFSYMLRFSQPGPLTSGENMGR